jgi:hypothetical protein
MPSVAPPPAVGWVTNVDDGYLKITEVFDRAIVAVGETSLHVLETDTGTEVLALDNDGIQHIDGDSTLVAVAKGENVHLVDATADEGATELSIPTESGVQQVAVYEDARNSSILAVSSDRQVYAFDPRGDVNWRADAGDSLGQRDELVFVERLESEGKILHVETGAELFRADWVTDTSWFLLGSQYYYHEETTTGIASPESKSSVRIICFTEEQIRGVDKTGKVVWQRKTSNPRPVAVSGSRTFVRLDADTEMSEYVCIAAEDGHVTERYGPARDLVNVGETLCLVGNGLTMRDRETGEIIFETESDASATLLDVDESTIFVEFTTANGARVAAYDIEQRERRWAITTPTAGSRSTSLLFSAAVFAVADGFVIAEPPRTHQDATVEFVAVDGLDLSNDDADVDVDALTGDSIVVERDDRAHVIDRATGEVVWSREDARIKRLVDSSFVWETDEEIGFVDRAEGVDWTRTLTESRTFDDAFVGEQRLWMTEVIDDENGGGMELHGFGRTDGRHESTRQFQMLGVGRWPERPERDRWGLVGVTDTGDGGIMITAVAPGTVQEFGPYAGEPVETETEAGHLIVATDMGVHGFRIDGPRSVRHVWHHATEPIWGISIDSDLCYLDGVGEAIDPATGDAVWDFDGRDDWIEGEPVYPVFDYGFATLRTSRDTPKYAGGYAVSRFEPREEQATHVVESTERLRTGLTAEADEIDERLAEARQLLSQGEPSKALVDAAAVYRQLETQRLAKQQLDAVQKAGFYGQIADHYGRDEAIERARDALEGGEYRTALEAVARAQGALDKAQSLTAVGTVLAVGVVAFPLLQTIERRREPARERGDLEDELHRVGSELQSTPSGGYARQTYATALEQYRDGDYTAGLETVSMADEQAQRERELSERSERLQRQYEDVTLDESLSERRFDFDTDEFETALNRGAYDQAESKLEDLAMDLEDLETASSETTEDTE